MIIMNHEGRFWLGQRIGTDTWQFPQGGIDKGESVREAMYRELQEETGLEKVKNPVIVDGDDKLLEIGKNRNWDCISFR